MRVVYLAFGIGGLTALGQLEQYISHKDMVVFTYEHSSNKQLLAYLKDNTITTFTEPVNQHQVYLAEFSPQAIISMCYRNKVAHDILELVSNKAINFHPSLLPEHRGAFSVPWALINGDRETGVTWHYMIDKLDEGNIVVQEAIPIESTDTAFYLYYKCLSKGAELFHKAWEKAIVKNDLGKPQQGEVSYHSRRLPYDGTIDPNWPHGFIERFIRAMWFPPHPPATLETEDGIVHINSVDEYEKWCQKLKRKSE